MKRIIVCVDGTTNDSEIFSDSVAVTNVLRLARAIRPRDDRNVVQVVSYISGVATGASDRGSNAKAVSAFGLAEKVQRAYEFITMNYEAGDQIFLFGFSRGAVIVRSLSAFSALFGIIPKELMDQFPAAWTAYQADQTIGAESAAIDVLNDNVLQARAAFGSDLRRRSIEAQNLEQIQLWMRDGAPELRDQPFRELPLHFLGVWDTVPGLVREEEGEHDMTLAWNVRQAVQALALHEVREAFTPAIWEWKRDYQDVTQTWFPGAHSDVGGGVLNADGTNDIRLSSAPLEWMTIKAKRLGLSFDEQYLRSVTTQSADLGPISYPGHETVKSQLAATLGGGFEVRDIGSFRARKKTVNHHGLPTHVRDLKGILLEEASKRIASGANLRSLRIGATGMAPLGENRHKTVRERLESGQDPDEYIYDRYEYAYDRDLLQEADRRAMQKFPRS